ncbi:plasmid mobilization relaxosome protein MobC [Lachnospiraceae bacterium 29-91]
MKGVITIAAKKTYNTPHRECIAKTRLTKEERQDFEEKCRTLSISQSEYLRQAIFYGKVSTTIKVTANNEEMLTAVSNLVAQYGKIGSNLNQIARHLNEYGFPYRELAAELKGCAADLAALKFEALKVIGEAYGNDKTYQL